MRQSEADQGIRGGLSTSDCERLKELERKNRELKLANEILRKASAYFAQAELVYGRPPAEIKVVFIDQYREQYGVEPICRQIQIAPSSYYEYMVRERDPDRLPDRIKRDKALEREIQRVGTTTLKSMAPTKYGGS